MSDKQKTETAASAAPQEVNDEALDQVNGGKTETLGSMTAGFSQALIVNGTEPAGLPVNKFSK